MGGMRNRLNIGQEKKLQKMSTYNLRSMCGGKGKM